MRSPDKTTTRMRDAFCAELDFEASLVFDEMSREEQDRLVGIDAEDGLDDYCMEAEIRAEDFANSLTEEQRHDAVLRHFLGRGGYIPSDSAEHYGLQEDLASRGWVRCKPDGLFFDGWYLPSTIDRIRAEADRDEADARDLAIGRTFGATLADIKAQTAKTAKVVVEARQGVEVLVQHLPDATKPPHITEPQAVAILKAKGVGVCDRTLRNWLEKGVAGWVKLPIKWDDLATVASWNAWAESYAAAAKTRRTRKDFMSKRGGVAEAERARRRGA